MAIPRGWVFTYVFNENGYFQSIHEARGVCPHCRVATTFQVRAFVPDSVPGRATIHMLLLCNYGDCRNTVYVETSTRAGGAFTRSESHDPFFVYPTGSIDPAHPSVPKEVADDWLEAQRCLTGGNPKAAAMMLRRVLYGVLLDKGCKLHPLREGMQALITGQRLPAIFDDWLPAIKDDGHDAAHPDRALKVSPENVVETMEYTAELLRYLYVEPYE